MGLLWLEYRSYIALRFKWLTLPRTHNYSIMVRRDARPAPPHAPSTLDACLCTTIRRPPTRHPSSSSAAAAKHKQTNKKQTNR